MLTNKGYNYLYNYNSLSYVTVIKFRGRQSSERGDRIYARRQPHTDFMLIS